MQGLHLSLESVMTGEVFMHLRPTVSALKCNYHRCLVEVAEFKTSAIHFKVDYEFLNESGKFRLEAVLQMIILIEFVIVRLIFYGYILFCSSSSRLSSTNSTLFFLVSSFIFVSE